MDISILREKFLEFYNPLRSEFYKELEAAGIVQISQEGASEDLGSGHFINILRKKQPVQSLPYSEFMIYDELDFVLQDLKYVIGILSVMRPYINNPRQEQLTYYQTLEDHLYLRYSSFGFQSIYEFWDRLGDLLHLFFHTKLKVADVYFGRVMRDIGTTHGSVPEFLALKAFYDSSVQAVLDQRHDIVHHYLLKSKARWDHIQHHDNPTQLRKDFEEKAGYLDVLFQQALNCINGYRLVLALINTLPDK
jgi:HEPN superfamily protein